MPQEAQACLPGGTVVGFPLVRRHRTRNGAGKPTTVRILATLTEADAGQAVVAVSVVLSAWLFRRRTA